jgi:predicted methyltransferase
MVRPSLLTELFTFAMLIAGFVTPSGLAAQARDPDLTKLGRPADEVARDGTSRPLELYRFFEIGPGTVVADLIAGGGYNTAILTHVVGEGGVVFSQNGRKNAIAERKAKGDFKDRANVVVFDSLAQLPSDTLDVALTVRNYHDVPQEGLAEWLKGIQRALKPGGIFAVVDVRTAPGFRGRATELHRIAEETVVEEVTAAGFTLEARADMLGSRFDKYESSEFGNREATDRMVLKFRKPAQRRG